MRTVFDDLLTNDRVLVADGAMGTSLFELGLEPGGCPELLNVERRDLIAKVHRGYVEAGSDIILTNTFGGNRCRLTLHGLESRVTELNTAAVELAQSVARSARKPVAVAGSIGPTGELFAPLGNLTHDEGVDVFLEQAVALADAGADVLWIETMSSFEELGAAVEAALQTSLPITITMSFDTAGHTMMGVSPAALAEWVENPRVVAVGANCGVGLTDNVAVVRDIAGNGMERAVIAKANCGVPLYQDGALAYPATASDMADYVELAVRSGARIVGACCGSSFDHIAEIRRAVDDHPGGAIPANDEIVARLGGAVPAVRRPAKRRRRA
jgi:5-methyltetrahydrofolate--homocysteine methyltransferase